MHGMKKGIKPIIKPPRSTINTPLETFVATENDEISMNAK